jgi:hypothetical protein
MIPRPSPAGYDVAAVLTGREAAPAMRWIHAKQGADEWLAQFEKGGHAATELTGK